MPLRTRAIAFFHRIVRSPSVGGGVGFALSGLAFTIGNLMLARTMSPVDYSRLALVVAAFSVTIWLAPIGQDQVMLRRGVDPDLRLLTRIAVSSLAVAIATMAVLARAYHLPVDIAAMMACAIGAGGVGVAGGLGLRRHGWPLLSIVVTNASSLSLLIAGIIGLGLRTMSSRGAVAILMTVAIVAAATAWITLGRRHRIAVDDRERVPRGEPVALLFVATSGVVGAQLERFVIPYALDLRSLATFAVLASIAISPFRLLRAGTAFAMVPLLRKEAWADKRQALVVSEVRTMAMILFVATLAATLLAPLLAQSITKGRYQLGPWLVLAACLNGGAKLLEGVPRSIITACGTTAEIKRLSWRSWLGIAAMAAGAWTGATWGLAGLVVGGALGSLCGSLPNVVVARRVLARGYIG